MLFGACWMKRQHTMPSALSETEPTEFPLIAKCAMSGAPAVRMAIYCGYNQELHETS